ncbi:MAG: hypothetical protein AB7N76_08390 [Planctomycetota bacterium]
MIPEDEANVRLVQGFLLQACYDQRAVQVLPPQRGWRSVLDAFVEEHAPRMQANQLHHALLLIDFDERLVQRRAEVTSVIPPILAERVFVLGVLSEPERLGQEVGLGDLEAIGRQLARDCPPPAGLWSHGLIGHNVAEAERLQASPVGRLVFPT